MSGNRCQEFGVEGALRLRLKGEAGWVNSNPEKKAPRPFKSIINPHPLIHTPESIIPGPFPLLPNDMPSKKTSFLITLLLPLVFLTISYRTLASPPDPDTTEAIEGALEIAIDEAREIALAYVIFDVEIGKLELSRNGRWAIIWLRMLDWDSGIEYPAEPGLAIAQLVNGAWKITLPSHWDWSNRLAEVPSDLLPAADKKHWQELSEGSCDTSGLGPFGGFLLPWAAGEVNYLTRSITHHNPPNPNGSMHYAFDFAAPGWPSPMFGIYSSKGGTVKWFRDSQPNGDEDPPGNYIVIEDTTTAPATYHLYLHLAQNTIPPQFKVNGAPVAQGQYLGLADDTGYSTGNHLHYQVHTQPNSYWGCSVDVLFDDVVINGGRPRTVDEANEHPEYGSQGQDTYVSQNTIRDDVTDPIGDLFTPVLGQVMTETVHIEGWAQDEGSGVETLQVYANWGTGWFDIGPPFFDELFAFDWNMCTDHQVPDGPVTFGMLVKDNAGNISDRIGIRTGMKSFDCAPQPPACQPAANQAAIFSEVGYGGECLTLEVGSHMLSIEDGLIQIADPERVGGAPLDLPTIASVLVGDDVMLTLFHELLEGRAQTLITDNPNLADDWTGVSEKTLAVVQLDTDPPPLSPAPVWPTGSYFGQDADRDDKS